MSSRICGVHLLLVVGGFLLLALRYDSFSNRVMC